MECDDSETVKNNYSQTVDVEKWKNQCVLKNVQTN